MRLRPRPTAPAVGRHPRNPNPVAASWRAWHRPDDLEAARAILARLEHHARTFPTPVDPDDHVAAVRLHLIDSPVVRRAAVDLLASIR